MDTLHELSPHYLAYEETLVSFVKSCAADQGIKARAALDPILHAARGNEVSSLKEPRALLQFAHIRTVHSCAYLHMVSINVNFLAR